MTQDETGLREAAQKVISAAEPDDDFDGNYIEFLVPADAIEDLRAALAANPAPAGLDVERLAGILANAHYDLVAPILDEKEYAAMARYVLARLEPGEGENR